ncbi:MAG: hypothetical protein VX193_02485, partial [Candidatus Thermoplasmatota archaeon]|nr:hypothetical protein [Candidatus Thermoplasmatota archaeon]
DYVVELFNPSDATVALEEGIPVALERRPEGQQEKLVIAWLDEVAASAAQMMTFVREASDPDAQSAFTQEEYTGSRCVAPCRATEPPPESGMPDVSSQNQHADGTDLYGHLGSQSPQCAQRRTDIDQ